MMKQHYSIPKMMILFILCLCLNLSLSLEAKGNETVAAFLDRSVGAKPAAMGMAFTAVSDTPSSLYMNPAGLSTLSNYSLQGMSYEAFETNYFSVEITAPLNNFHFALGYIGASVPGIQETKLNGNAYEATGTSFSYNGGAIFFGLGYEVLDGLHLGTSVKYIQEKLYNNKATGYGLDVGMLYQFKLATNETAIGIHAKNVIAPKMKWDTASAHTDEMAREYAIGLSIRLLNNSLTLSSDYRLKGETGSLHAGIEYIAVTIIPLRAGYDDEKLSFGIGLLLGDITLDYSMTMPQSDYKDFLDNISRFSVGITL